MALLFWLLVVAGHSVLWVGLVNRSHGLGIHRRLIDLATLLGVGAFGTIPIAIGWAVSTPETWLPSINAFSDFPLPVRLYIGGCLALLAAAIGRETVQLFVGERIGVAKTTKREVLDVGAKYGPKLMKPGLPRFLSGLPGNELLKPTAVETTLYVPNLPAALDGFTIAHLSDLHMSGRFGVEYFKDVIAHTNAWQPDLVALTGDLVEYDHLLPWVDETLHKLTAKHGVYYVLGNHDKKNDHAAVRARLKAGGLIDLGSTHHDIEVNGSLLRLIGNELPWFKPPGDPAAPSEQPIDFRLLLAHGPDQFAWACRHEIELILAGHNHGGQIRFPLLGAIVSPSLTGVRYASGAFRREETIMHVCQGTGSLSPLRFNCPPEFSLLTLRSDQRA